MIADYELWEFANEPEPEGSKLERAFWEFHRANPHVYEWLVSYSRNWRNATKGKCGMQMLFEVLRYETMIKTRDAHFKINNNYAAFYSRLIMERESDLAGLFSLRQQRIQATFGPDNDTLPPGDHVA